MKRITVTASTIGQSSASPVTLSGGYKYRGDPDWVPGDARYREPGSPANRMAAGSGGAVNTERRQERLRGFAAALADLGHPDPVQAPNPAVVEAGERIGVGEKTAKSYRTELKQQRQSGEAHDA
jgi:hypothetical protein